MKNVVLTAAAILAFACSSNAQSKEPVFKPFTPAELETLNSAQDTVVAYKAGKATEAGYARALDAQFNILSAKQRENSLVLFDKDGTEHTSALIIQATLKEVTGLINQRYEAR